MRRLIRARLDCDKTLARNSISAGDTGLKENVLLYGADDQPIMEHAGNTMKMARLTLDSISYNGQSGVFLMRASKEANSIANLFRKSAPVACPPP